MKTIHRTYKFRLKPNSKQKILLAKHFGCARFVYNHFLAERQEEYKNEGKSSNYYTQQARLTELKKGEYHSRMIQLHRRLRHRKKVSDMIPSTEETIESFSWLCFFL